MTCDSIRSATMDSKYFQKCIFIFHLLGQNSYDLRANKFSAWLHYIPRVSYVLLTIGLIVRHCLFDGYLKEPEALVLYLILAIAFAINALVFLESFVVPNGVRKLNFAYQNATDYLEQKMYVKIDYELFKRSFQCHVKIVFWTFLLTLTIKMIFAFNGDARYIEFVIVFFYYLKHFASTHILFHVEFVHFLMQTINMEFNPMTNQNEFMVKTTQPKTIESLQILCHLKCIHLRMWKIIQIHNTRFGWILIALMLATTLDITYSSYWIWIFIHNTCHEHINLFMRKYVFCILRFY